MARADDDARSIHATSPTDIVSGYVTRHGGTSWGQARPDPALTWSCEMTHRHDPEGHRLPVKLDTTTNGEFAPIPLSPTNIAANRLARDQAGHNARRVGMQRRDFLITDRKSTR